MKELLADLLFTYTQRILEFYNKVANLIWHGKWVFCYHEDKDIIPIGFADWKCGKCGIEL